MFKFLFYIFGILAITYEFWSIYHYDTIKALEKKVIDTPKEKINQVLNTNEQVFILLQFGYWFWALVGLFTSQWVLFLFLLLLSLVSQLIKSKNWNYVDSWLSATLIGFMIINTYHLHINVGKGLLDFFLDR